MPAAAAVLWTAATVLAYAVALRLYRRSAGHWLALPVVVGTAIIVVLLLATGTPYPDYAQATSLLQQLAGPAVVALAVPLYRQMAQWRGRALAISAAVLAGSAASMLAGAAVAFAFGLPEALSIALAPRSATMPVAMAAAQANGGIGPLAAVGVVITGVLGSATVRPLLRWLGVDRDHADAMMLGLVAHAIGVAQARLERPQVLACAALAMTLMAVVAALWLPLLVRLLRS